MSSNILSEEFDVTRFGLIYAGAQKNIAPAGLTVVIVKKELTGNAMPICPTMLKYTTYAENENMPNTPPCFSIYTAMYVLEWLKDMGGLKAIKEVNYYKAGLLYDFIDNSKFYRNDVQKEFRSVMNVPFVTPGKELDEKFVKEAQKAGLVSLKGHRLMGAA